MKTTTEKTTKQFIACVASKNYSEANTYLQKMVENKLKDKVKTAFATKK